MPTNDLVMVDDKVAKSAHLELKSEMAAADEQRELLVDKRDLVDHALVKWDAAAGSSDRRGLIRTPIRSLEDAKLERAKMEEKAGKSLLAKVRQRRNEKDMSHAVESGQNTRASAPAYVHYRNFRRHLKDGRLPLRLCFGDMADVRGTPGAEILGHALQTQEIKSTEGTALGNTYSEDKVQNALPLARTQMEEEDDDGAKMQAEDEPYEFSAYDFARTGHGQSIWRRTNEYERCRSVE